MLAYLKDDVYRVTGVRSWQSVLVSLVARRTFRPIVTARLLHWAKGGLLRRPLMLLLLPIHVIFRWSAAMDLPHQAQLGRGFRIDHGWGLVINSNAKIGQNVTLFHGVTLGQSDHVNRAGERSTTFPVIEDEVWIGPNAVIAGVKVGRGSRIAGGAFVSFDVPAHSLVIGNPATVVRSGVLPDVVNPVERIDS